MNLFDKIEPVFFIDDEMKEYIYNIDNKLSVININDKQKRKYMITKSKVRSIHSSLAIEENSLSLFDVENISNNKQILGKIPASLQKSRFGENTQSLIFAGFHKIFIFKREIRWRLTG